MKRWNYSVPTKNSRVDNSGEYKEIAIDYGSMGDF